MIEREEPGGQLSPMEFIAAITVADFDILFDEEERSRLTSFLGDKALGKGSFVLAFNTGDGGIVRVHYPVEGTLDMIHVGPASRIYTSSSDSERPEELKDIPMWWHGTN